MKHWYVFYTYPKSEKALKQELEKVRYEVFLPLQKVTRQWKDRKKIMEWPLFPNYIFVKTAKEQVYHILNYPKIIRYVSFEGRPATLSEEEIILISEAIKIDQNICLTSWQKGDRIQIKEGILKDYEGILSEIKGKRNFGFYLKEVKQMIWIDITKIKIEKLSHILSSY